MRRSTSFPNILLLALLLAFLNGATRVASAQEQDQVKGTVAEPADAAEIRQQIALAEKLMGVVPDRGGALYLLAEEKQHFAETLEVLRLLKECVALREGFDPSGGPSFTGLKEQKEFQDMVESVHRDFPVATQGRIAFVTEEKDLIPEGLAYDEKRNVFYMSSLNRRKIVQIAADGKVTDFVPAERDNLLPVLGIRMDPNDATVWANSFSERGKTELLHFSATGELLGRYAPADSAKHGFNDLVVRRNGDVIATDSLNGKVFRFDRKTEKFSALQLKRALSYPNGIALSDDDTQLFIADDLGVVRMDLASGTSDDVNPGVRNTLAGIDGLYWHKGFLVGIQNGIGSPRVAVFRLSKDGLRVTQTTVLENRSALTSLPTTGAIKGNDFYFIVNSQIDNMNDDKVLDKTKLERIRIGVVRLP
jgi:SMP-30/Gluconolactonase/LRE-like region